MESCFRCWDFNAERLCEASVAVLLETGQQTAAWEAAKQGDVHCVFMTLLFSSVPGHNHNKAWPWTMGMHPILTQLWQYALCIKQQPLSFSKTYLIISNAYFTRLFRCTENWKWESCWNALATVWTMQFLHLLFSLTSNMIPLLISALRFPRCPVSSRGFSTLGANSSR